MINYWTLNTIWYRLLEENIKVSRGYIKRLVKTLCDKCGISRASLNIFTGVRAELYFDGGWTSVSFDRIEELAEKGTDIVFVEKEGIPVLITDFANKYGIAMVNSRGHLTEYGMDLMNATKKSGAHVVIMTDYDNSGIKIASETPTKIPWIGANDKMLVYFNLDKNRVSVDAKVSKKGIRQHHAYISSLIENGRHPDGRRDERFKDVDTDFLYNKRVELDSIIARTGGERFFDYIMDQLKELYPKRDYNRAIEIPSKGIEAEHEDALTIIDERVKAIIQSQTDTEEEALRDVSGFIDVKDKLEEIKKRLVNVLTDNPHYQDFTNKLNDLVDAHPFFKEELN